MLTKEKVLEIIKDGKESGCIDYRDFGRLTYFFPVKDWDILGFKPQEENIQHNVEDWTEENILKHLREDLDFAFTKALNKRGISASLMFEVIKMWMWVLEDDLQYFSEDNYAMYGLPLFKAVAVKYNLPNEIGDDLGNEKKYED